IFSSLSSVSLFISLLLHRYRDHSDLHSFPTRRSSDLNGGIYEMELTRAAINAKATAISKLKPEFTGSAYKSLAKRLKFKPNPYIDRKSTRLNSSHVSISYAVFCLKKKIKKKVRRSHNL